MKVGILGAGYSGICLAIFLARQNIDVVVIEHTDMALKKILSTGNGRCNYTNEIQNIEKYHNNHLAFKIIQDFCEKDTLKFFEELGVEAIFRDSYAYPYSEQAKSIREALLLEIERLQIKILYNTELKNIKYNKKVTLELKDINKKSISLEIDKFVFATGGKAFAKSGSDGSALKFLDNLKIKYNEFLPALAPLYAKEKNFLNLASGVRAMAKVSLIVDEEKIYAEYGQVQLTSYGLSGIPIFNLSALANKNLKIRKEVKVKVDFLSQIKDKYKFLKERIQLELFKEAKDLGNGILNDKLFLALLKRAGIKANKEIKLLTDKDIEVLAKIIENSVFNIYYHEDFDKAQVATGGIDIKDLDSGLSHKEYKNIYFVGEIIDVDAICGGYNLQWGISSAKAVANSLEKENKNA